VRHFPPLSATGAVLDRLIPPSMDMNFTLLFTPLLMLGDRGTQ